MPKNRYSVLAKISYVRWGFRNLTIDLIDVAQDINFTLRRIERLRSLSRDYILIPQALQNFDKETFPTREAPQQPQQQPWL